MSGLIPDGPKHREAFVAMNRAVVLLVLLPSCTAGTGRPPTTETACTNGSDDDRDGLADCADPDCSPTAMCEGVDAGPRPDVYVAPCIGTPYDATEAYAPIDIIWVIDTSGSMENEAESVQNNMQAFAMAIGAVGLDWHVVMISTQAFVNVPEPLASDPRYLLINRDVSSNEPLRALLAEFPNYQHHLRRRAFTHFVAVTDDESDLMWESFRDQMRTNLGRNFVFHTISSELAGPPSFMYPDGEPCTTGSGFPPEGAAAPGVEYWELAAATGGRTFSICTPPEEWESLFDTLTTAIAVPQRIPCEYELPTPASGMLNFYQVNVRYTSGAGATTTFPYAYDRDAGEIDCTTGGWYYDIAPQNGTPTRIVLCPSSCESISGDTSGRVDVELGCVNDLI